MSCSWLDVSAAAISLQGRVLDTHGKPVKHALVTLYRPPLENGTEVTTIFSNATGEFNFPGKLLINGENVKLEVIDPDSI